MINNEGENGIGNKKKDENMKIGMKVNYFGKLMIK